ncbi:MAG: tyrosine-type recombinase/integrase [Acidobacteria bacterium]|nr:tyrosine-type recombinase/integrase [Acidobacteriota bacterium]
MRKNLGGIDPLNLERIYVQSKNRLSSKSSIPEIAGQGLGLCQSGHGEAYHQESLQKRQIKRAAKLAKLGEDIGWHKFRHTYRSWLDETGAPMKVQQELMRHASIQTTMNVMGGP